MDLGASANQLIKSGKTAVFEGWKEVLTRFFPGGPAAATTFAEYMKDRYKAKLHRPKPKQTDANTLDNQEVKALDEAYDIAFDYTKNPFKIAFRLFLKIFGSDIQENRSAALDSISQAFQNNQYGLGSFANHMWSKLDAGLKRYIKKKQGFLSRIFSPNKLANDPIVQKHMQAMKQIAKNIPDIKELRVASRDAINSSYSFVRAGLGNYMQSLVNKSQNAVNNYRKQQLHQAGIAA